MSDQPDELPPPLLHPLTKPPARYLPPLEAGERETLTAFLDFQRATLAVKCAGLTAEQLRIQAVPPSSLSLLGLVRHMAEVERNWFRPVLEGAPMASIFAPGLDWERSFDDVADADPAAALAAWEAECDHARNLVAAAPSLDVAGDRDGRGTFSLRWVLIHLVEEYARHNGHADLLRERIDGATGQLSPGGTTPRTPRLRVRWQKTAIVSDARTARGTTPRTPRLRVRWQKTAIVWDARTARGGPS